MPITKGGVYYNLDESNFEFQFKKGKTEILFVFSSLSHLKKFAAQIDEYIINFNNTMKRRYGIDPNMNGYPAMVLYSQIETRGFKMYWKGYEYFITSLMIAEELLKEGVLNG